MLVFGRGCGDLIQDGITGDGEKLGESGCIVKIDPMGLDGDLDMGDKQRFKDVCVCVCMHN